MLEYLNATSNYVVDRRMMLVVVLIVPVRWIEVWELASNFHGNVKPFIHSKPIFNSKWTFEIITLDVMSIISRYTILHIYIRRVPVNDSTSFL